MIDKANLKRINRRIDRMVSEGKVKPVSTRRKSKSGQGHSTSKGDGYA